MAAELYIADKTVENHVRNILAKLHLNRKQELIRYAVDHGIEWATGLALGPPDLGNGLVPMDLGGPALSPRWCSALFP